MSESKPITISRLACIALAAAGLQVTAFESEYVDSGISFLPPHIACSILRSVATRVPGDQCQILRKLLFEGRSVESLTVLEEELLGAELKSPIFLAALRGEKIMVD